MSRFVLRDRYFQKAKEHGFRARSAYKLQEIQEKFKLIKKGGRVLDLGCAPGSFLQVIVKIVGPEGLVLGIDILPVEALPQKNVVTLQEDIRETDVAGVCALHAPKGFDIITCDIAPNLSGIKEADDKNVGELYDAVRDVVVKGLRTGGHFAMKTFFSDNFRATKSDLAGLFRSVSVFKPLSSRSISSETYLVATGKK